MSCLLGIDRKIDWSQKHIHSFDIIVYIANVNGGVSL